MTGVVRMPPSFVALPSLASALGARGKSPKTCSAKLRAPGDGGRFPVLEVLGADAAGAVDQGAGGAGGELGEQREVGRPLAVGEAGQVFGLLDLVLRLGDRLALALALEPARHPAVHRLAHRLVVGVRRLEGGVATACRPRSCSLKIGRAWSMLFFASPTLNWKPSFVALMTIRAAARPGPARRPPR